MQEHSIVAHRVLRTALVASTLSFALLVSGGQDSALAGQAGNVTLETMGAYSFAGTVISNPAGLTSHCDHGYAEYFTPVGSKKLPIVMWHSSSTKTWQTAFDGREGWQPIFLRRGFPIFIIDLPRQGRASWGCEPLPANEMPTYRDQSSFAGFRFGTWTPPAAPVWNPGVQEPQTEEVLNEMARTRYPELNGLPFEQLESDAVSVLLNKIGPAILMGHSGSSRRTMWTAIKNPNVKGIVAMEGSQLFPAGDPGNPPGAVTVPEADFMKLVRIPILVELGDYLDSTASGQLAIASAKAFVQAVNNRGGKAKLLYLPDLGIHGNTHFAMSDLNNVQVADLVSEFFKDTGLDANQKK
jgi:pimeloyl-ACP methyl ester carboxylesterase